MRGVSVCSALCCYILTQLHFVHAISSISNKSKKFNCVDLSSDLFALWLFKQLSFPVKHTRFFFLFSMEIVSIVKVLLLLVLLFLLLLLHLPHRNEVRGRARPPADAGGGRNFSPTTSLTVHTQLRGSKEFLWRVTEQENKLVWLIVFLFWSVSLHVEPWQNCVSCCCAVLPTTVCPTLMA